MPRLKTLAPRVKAANLSITRQQQTREPSTRPYDAQRGNSTQRGYGYKWQQASKGWLAKHPLCVHCQAERLVTAATEVDHIVPHRGDMNLFWDRSNWQSLCKPHHSTKTARGE